LKAAVSKAAHYSVTVKFHFNIIKIKNSSVYKKYIYPSVKAKGENPHANRAVPGAFFMLLEKHWIHIFKGLQIQIRGIRMTGPEIKHFFTH